MDRLRAAPSTLAGAARFSAAVLVLTGLVRLVACVPEVLDDGPMRRYASLDHLRDELRVRLLAPSYFPAHLAFPAREQLAGRRPHVAIVQHFDDRASGEPALALAQAEAGAPPKALPPTRLEPTRILATESAELHGVAATVETAICADGRPCNRVSGVIDGRPFRLVSRGPLEEAVTIARSLAVRSR